MYEFFEHTADLGLRVRAPDLEGLFVESARGLFAMIAEPPPTAAGRQIEVQVDGDRPDYLLFDWLSELLFVFDSRQLLLADFRVEIRSADLLGFAQAEPLDPSRHRLLHEVKAITYHGLRVEPTDQGWLAEIIVDI
jgi:SHS2 domain-containing protein